MYIVLVYNIVLLSFIFQWLLIYGIILKANDEYIFFMYRARYPYEVEDVKFKNNKPFITVIGSSFHVLLPDCFGFLFMFVCGWLIMLSVDDVGSLSFCCFYSLHLFIPYNVYTNDLDWI